MKFNILGTGSYIPERVLTNDELSTMVDATDKSIQKLVGIKERHISVNETTSQMAAKAAEKALEQSGTKPEELDLILAVTMTAEYSNPGISAMVQKYIGATCPAMDIGGAACTGFIYLLETAAAFLSTEKYNKILLLASERLSSITDWSDKDTAIIFADGAGALVIDGNADNLLTTRVNTFGDDETIVVPNTTGSCPFHEGEKISEVKIYMNGTKTYRFAIAQMRETVGSMMEELNITDEDIKWVLPHQANIRIINEAKKKMPISPEKIRTTIEKYGNISSACIPVLLDELNRAGELEKGDILVLTAFGGGLHSGGAVIRW